MNRQTFLESFGHIAEAPRGVDKLRGLVLDLAVRGKLTNQNAADEPAAVLLERISIERSASGQRSGRGRRSVSEGSMHLPDGGLPAGWSWARLSDVGDFVGGNGFPKTAQEGKAGPIPFCKVSDMNLPGNERWIQSAANCVTPEVARALRATAHKPGTVIFPKIGGAIATNKRRQLVTPTIIDNNCMGISPRGDLSPDWLYTLLLSVDMTDYQAGTSLPAVSQGALSAFIFGLPPVAEQHRIVERVDELMALCDELAEQQVARAAARSALTTATLFRIVEADGADLRTEMVRFAERLGLYLAPGEGDRNALQQLRQAIVDLAVMGRLTRRDVGDQPAYELLDEVAAERDRLVKAKVIRKPKPVAPIEANSQEFLVREGWSGCRLGDLILSSDSGWSPSCLPEQRRSEEQWAVLKVSAVSWGTFRANEHKVLTPGLEPRLQLEVNDGDFIMSRANTAELVGRSVVASDPPPRLMLSDKHVRLRFRHRITAEYANIVNGSTRARVYYASVSSGTSDSMRNITREQILALPVVLPPLSEQGRIVTRVAEMNTICDELEKKLETAQALRGALAASVVSAVAVVA